MHVALVSCGPSAAAFAEADHAGPVIAVSKAATIWRADHWACFDWPVLKRITDSILGTPRLFTLSATLYTLHRHRNPWADEAGIAETLLCPVPKWTLYTAPAALVLAHELGATVVDAYGVDMCGDGDVTGDPGEDRSEGRWERERAIWDAVAYWLDGEGIEVIRHGPAQLVAPEHPQE